MGLVNFKISYFLCNIDYVELFVSTFLLIFLYNLDIKWINNIEINI